MSSCLSISKELRIVRMKKNLQAKILSCLFTFLYKISLSSHNAVWEFVNFSVIISCYASSREANY